MNKNDIDLVGVAYDARISSYHIMNDDNHYYSNFSDEHDIINNSWGTTGPAYSLLNLEKAYKEFVSNGRNGLGGIIIFPSGNDKTQGKNANFGNPVGQYVIVVGGINKPDNQFFLDSNIDEFATPGSNMLVSAPASHFPVLDADCTISASMSFECNYKFKNMEGTSFAAPLVSGIVALMLEANQNLGWRDVQDILAITAVYKNTRPNNFAKYESDKNNTDPEYYRKWYLNKATNHNGGSMHFSNQYGFGVVDAKAAVKLSESWMLKQTSNNHLILTKLTPQSYVGNLKCKEDMLFSFQYDESFDVEYAQTGITMPSSIEKTVQKVMLQSPSGTTSVLLDLSVWKTSKEFNIDFKELGSSNFRGENANGTWQLLIKTNQMCIEEIERDKSYLSNLKLYCKDKPSTTLYYTNEFSGFDGEENRKIVPTKHYDTINAAAVSGNVIIDLAINSTSRIFDTELTLNKRHKIVNLITGDGDDTLIGTPKDNIFVPGRGENYIYTGTGNDIIYFPNLHVHTGITRIDAFTPGITKLQFGKDIDYAYITSHMESDITNNSIINDQNFSIVLNGVDGNNISESSFVFGDLIMP